MTTTDIGLVLFCRRPAPGVGKQRLAAGIGAGPAAEAAELLLATALEDLDAWPGPVALAPADAADCDWATTLLPRPVAVVAQPAGNLGERLNAVDRQLRARGARRLIYMGSDAPELRPEDYAVARTAMDAADVVLGPAIDGGVTLMGANAAWPALGELPWSTDQLGDELARLCEGDGRRIERIVPRGDVDVADDLERAARLLNKDPRPARQRLVHWWQAARPRADAAS